MDPEVHASSAADVIDSALTALHRQLAELTIEKARTDAELAKARAENEKARAENEKARAEKEKARAEKEKAQAEKEKAQAEKEKAQAEKEKAQAEKEKAQADAVEKAVLAEKARPGAAIAVDRAFPKPRPFDNFLKAEASARVLQVHSSTAEGRGVLQKELAVFTLDATPQDLSLAALDQTRSLGALIQFQLDPASLLHQRNVYPLMTSFLPTWVPTQHRQTHASRGGVSAKSLFIGEGTPPDLPHIVLPWHCKPEILTSADAFHPAFNAEAKFVTSAEGAQTSRLYDQLVTYVTLGIVGSMFVAVPEGCRRFFTRPPVGYGLAAMAHVGYLVAVEWVGRLFVSVVSQPFFLGSPEHEAAIATLPDYDYEDSYQDIDFADIPVLTLFRDDGTPRVTWRSQGAEGDEFFKVIGWNSYDARHFKHMLQVYTALSAAWDKCPSDAVPPSLVRASMLFGAGQVCVKMPWVGGRNAEAADLDFGGCAVEPVARAIVWLAKQGLLYVDLRPPNVRVAAHDRVFLVDYDDMALCKPPTCAKELITELQDDPAQATIGWAYAGRERALPAVLDAIRLCW
jgi:hypothetical protein